VKVSVCLITYNHERFIAQALDSVLMQTGVEFELVVGDDCSTDGTRALLLDYQRRHPNRLRLLLPEQNQGMLPNFTRTIQACKGEYVALLEGDDYWTDPTKLRKQAAYLDAHRDCVLCFHTVAELDESAVTPSRYYPPHGQRKATYSLDDLLVINPMHTCSVMFRNGLIDTFPSWFYRLRLGDWALHLLHAQYGSAGYLPEVMAVYRRHSGGEWSTQSQLRRAGAIMTMLGYFDHHTGGCHRRAVRRSFSRLYYHLATECFRAGDQVLGRQYALRRLSMHPFNGDATDRHVPLTLFMLLAPGVYLTLKALRDRLPDQDAS
jgi:glycosyltransferase involved in cell wall biosynthesis